ncbi:uncharacterized protein LOC127137388 [Lathyrus oleraceus]|uniref:uncharacterized protein LOC127137388 n=1 Tax=Pisum sativum TaxID=3888 RepID=UPI0021D2BB61|nr:uncharacterized protein LOC127137388 [Pisum sativum]
MPEPLPWWYKPGQHYAYQQGAPGHDIENYYSLKYEVQQLVKSGMVPFEDRAPNVKANLLHAHGNSYVNMVDGYPGKYIVFDVRRIQRSLVELHKTLCQICECGHGHYGCVICSVNSRRCKIVKGDIQKLMDEGMIQINQARDLGDDVNVIVLVFKTPERVVIQYDSRKRSNRSVSLLVIRLVGVVSYTSDKAVPSKNNATMIKDGQKVPLSASNLVVSISDVVKVTRSGRVFSSVSPKVVKDVIVRKKVEAVIHLVDHIKIPICQSGDSSDWKVKDDNGELLRMIKKSEFNIMEQLLQTPSKISILSLLINFKAHQEALQKVLQQAYVEHDVTVDQLVHIVANITSCNNLSFCDEELPEEGRNHNLTLHISMNCKEDALSNVLVETGSSLNVLPKSTLARLSYQGAPMIYSGVIVKAFDGSRAITSTLHQKLKFVKNEKFVIIGGEKALLIKHLSSFTYVEVEEAVRTLFQALSVANVIQKTGASMSSFKDAQKIFQADDTDN